MSITLNISILSKHTDLLTHGTKQKQIQNTESTAQAGEGGPRPGPGPVVRSLVIGFPRRRPVLAQLGALLTTIDEALDQTLVAANRLHGNLTSEPSRVAI